MPKAALVDPTKQKLPAQIGTVNLIKFNKAACRNMENESSNEQMQTLQLLHSQSVNPQAEKTTSVMNHEGCTSGGIK